MSTGYRPPSREPQGRWARHIHAVRRQKDWSAQRAFEELRRAGLPMAEKSRSAYLKIDSGERQPKPAEEPFLIQVYGVPQESPDAEPSGEGDLAASIRELADAIRQERAERLEWERGVLESVQALARALTQRDDPEPSPLGGAQR